MRYRISDQIPGLDGSIITGLNGPRDTLPITYARLFITVAANGDPAGDTPEDKLDSYRLGLKLVRATDGIVDLTEKEVTRLRVIVAKVYTPTIVGRAVDFLAQPMTEKEAAPPPVYDSLNALRPALATIEG